MKQRLMDYHLHTVHSMDGRQTMDELCSTMVQRGVEEICLTEHIEPGHPSPELDIPPIWDVWFHEIQQMRVKYPMLTIRAGVEIGDNPKLRDRIKADMDALPLDFRLLSLHLVNGVDCYDVDDYFGGKTRAQAYREYAEAKAESILAWNDFDSVAHIGYAAKFSAYTGADRALVYEDAPDVFDAILEHIIDLGKCLEVNTSGYATTGDTFAHSSIIKRYIELGGENFTFGSDSHDVERDYADVERAKEMVRQLGGKYQAAFDQRRMTLYRI
ncbi:MAG: histidinol-phosphatase HisJ family protein [Clostridia bacterium]|nr:histidinol-phosphatase HisJ family protein [Clostridia bacterium]